MQRSWTYGVYAFFVSLFTFGSGFEIINSTSQQYGGGRQESGQGTRYQIEIRAKADGEALYISQLWIGNDYWVIQDVKNLSNPEDYSFKEGDILQIAVQKHVNNFNPDANLPTTYEPCPINYQGVALIGYTYNGKQMYEEVKSFKELEIEARP